MSDEEKAILSGSIELADDFVVIQPRKPKSRKRWLLLLCLIITAIAVLWFYYSFSHPLILITHESKQIISERVLSGIPVFPDNDILAFSRSSGSGGVVFAFRQLTPSGKQFYTKAYSKAEYLQPMVSSDAFIFTLKQYNTPRIYVLPLNETPRELAYGEWASFSNDGKRIVFQRDEMIWVMNSDGSDQESTNLKGQHPECSPKRDLIVFEGNSVNVSSIQTAEIKNPEQSLKTLTKKDDCLYPSFSPDGRLVIFYKKGDGLWVMNRNGSRQQRILRAIRSPEIMMGRISPDGKRLAVWSGTKNEGKLSIYKIKYRNIHPSKQKIDVSRLVELIDSIKKDSDTQNQPNPSVEVSESVAYIVVNKVTPKEGIQIYIDDNKLVTTPIDDPISVEPGQHTIKLENPDTGTTWEEEHKFQIGETYKLPEIDLR